MTAPIDMLPLLEELALEAGVAIMKIYAEDFVAEYKDDQSPVTEADTAAEEIIIAGLKTISTDIPIVAEETFAAGHSPDISGGKFWLVDPLDGTQEFVRKNGEFTVNIALIEDGQAICGVVYAPALRKIYAGVVGKGAHSREEGSASRDIHIRPTPDEGVTVVASRRHGDPTEIEKLLEGRSIIKIHNAGSSLKFCIIAEGGADIYPRFGRTMEWDTAAGQAVLEAAGGRVTTLDGAPFRYAKEGYENPNFIAWGGLDNPSRN
jgi:3'(2'), 5'-bisphosphate nucleotidase